MSEPKTQATRIATILPNVYRWHAQYERIDGNESDAPAVVDYDGGVVLIDLLLAKEQLRRLGEITAILTPADHPRSVSCGRRIFEGDAFAPEDALDLEDLPDPRFSGGECLPNNLVVVVPESPAP